MIAVIMPSIDREKAQKSMVQLRERSGMSDDEVDYMIIMDNKRQGFVSAVNDFVLKTDYKYYVYTAQDAFGGKDWLKIAFDKLEETGKGLFAFNDGKWAGELAAFGMVRAAWKKPFFYSGYKSHYADTELTIQAEKENQLTTDLKSLLIEVDYNKHGVNLDDKKLFQERNPNSKWR